MDEWLNGARDAIATEDVDRALLERSEEDVDTLPDVARIAAHVSGERTNAPLDELAEAVRRSTS